MSLWGDIKHGLSKIKDAASAGVKKIESAQRKAEKEFKAAERKARTEGLRALATAEQEAEKRLRNLTSELLGNSVGEILNSLVDLAQRAIPGKHSQIPLIPCTPFTPGLGVDIDLNASIDVIQSWANNPPTRKAEYLAMLLDIAGEQDVLILLPAGNGRIPIAGHQIEQWLEKILP